MGIAGASSAAHLLWGVFGSVYLVFATEELGLGPAAIGVIAAVGGASSFVGAVLAQRVSRRVGIGPAILVGMIGFTLGNALTPLAPAGAVVIAVALLVAQQLIADGSGTIAEINEISLVQTVAPDRVLGRVNGSLEFLTHLWLLMGTIAGGLIGEAYGLRTAMLIGVLGGFAAIVFLWRSPIRSLRAEASAPPPHALVPGEDTSLTE
jgi:MFS family permease